MIRVWRAPDVTQVQQKGPLAQVCAGEVCHAIFSAKTLGLLAHILNQFGAP